jgi:hypothetical protein
VQSRVPAALLPIPRNLAGAAVAGARHARLNPHALTHFKPCSGVGFSSLVPCKAHYIFFPSGGVVALRPERICFAFPQVARSLLISLRCSWSRASLMPSAGTIRLLASFASELATLRTAGASFRFAPFRHPLLLDC